MIPRLPGMPRGYKARLPGEPRPLPVAAARTAGIAALKAARNAPKLVTLPMTSMPAAAPVTPAVTPVPPAVSAAPVVPSAASASGNEQVRLLQLRINSLKSAHAALQSKLDTLLGC